MDLGNHNATIGGLSGPGLIYANDIPQPTLTLGANNHAGTFTGVIQDSTVGLGVTLGVVKSGTGSQTYKELTDALATVRNRLSTGRSRHAN